MTNIIDLQELEVKKFGYSFTHKFVINTLCSYATYIDPKDYKEAIIEYILKVELNDKPLEPIFKYIGENSQVMNIIRHFADHLDYNSQQSIINVIRDKWPLEPEYINLISLLSELYAIWKLNKEDESITNFSFSHFLNSLKTHVTNKQKLIERKVIPFSKKANKGIKPRRI